MIRKSLGLLGLFIAFYLGAHYYIRWKNTVTDDVTKIGRLVECQPNDARELTLHQVTSGKAEELSFRRADELALAMEARCYVPGVRRTRLHPLRAGRKDVVLLLIAAASVALASVV